MDPQTISSFSSLKHHFQQYYQELKQIAPQKLRYERINHTLDTAALLHEAYGKLYQQSNNRFRSSSHFLEHDLTSLINQDYTTTNGINYSFQILIN